MAACLVHYWCLHAALTLSRNLELWQHLDQPGVRFSTAAVVDGRSLSLYPAVAHDPGALSSSPHALDMLLFVAFATLVGAEVPLDCGTIPCRSWAFRGELPSRELPSSHLAVVHCHLLASQRWAEYHVALVRCLAAERLVAVYLLRQYFDEDWMKTQR